MAYAFNALDNYFKRDKTKTQGGGELQKGAGMGAPPPTAAAENLAKTAETSDEQGNAAGRFQALQKAPIGSIAGRLAAPGQQQAASWQAGAEKAKGEYEQRGQQQISEAMPEYQASDVGAAERGEGGAQTKLRQQLAPTEMTFQPLQIETPTLDTTSMLRGGIGGIQAALQKRGGRYTPGMAAMDASALAANRQAVQALQSQFGGIQQGMRQKAGEVAGVAGTLGEEAKTRGERIAKDVKEALGTRIGEFEKAAEAAAKSGAEKAQSAEEKAAKERAKGMTGIDYTPIVESSQVGTYTTDIDPAYANLAAILGVDPKVFAEQYAMYNPNQDLIDAYLRGKAEEDRRRQEQLNKTFTESIPAPSPTLPPGTPPGTPVPNTSTPTVSTDTGKVTQAPTPGQLAIAGGTPVSTSAPITQTETKPMLVPTQGTLAITTPQQQTPKMPISVAKDLAASFGGFKLPGATAWAMDFYKKNGRWPTKAEIKKHK